MLKIHKGRIDSVTKTRSGDYMIHIIDSFTGNKESYHALDPLFSKDEIFFYLDEYKYYIESAFKVNKNSIEKVDQEISKNRATLVNSEKYKTKALA